MHHYDAFAIALTVVAFLAIPPTLVLPWISIFAVRPKLSIIFSIYLGACGFLALGIAQAGRIALGPGTHRSDYHGILAYGLVLAIPTFGAAIVMLGRAMTLKRVWKVIGSAALLALGADVALGCLALHQIFMADHYRSAAESGLIFAALLGGVPVALLGLVLLSITSARAAKAEEAAAAAEPPKADPPKAEAPQAPPAAAAAT